MRCMENVSLFIAARESGFIFFLGSRVDVKSSDVAPSKRREMFMKLI